jgi:hypothetical protein
MSHFNGFHFMPYLGRRPSCSGQDILPFYLVFLSNDLMIVRFDEMVTVIKHPLETRKNRMVFNELLLFKT